MNVDNCISVSPFSSIATQITFLPYCCIIASAKLPKFPRNHILTHSPFYRNRQNSQQTQPCLNQLLVAVLEVVRKERIVNGFKPFVLMAGHLCQALFGDIGGDS